MCQLESAGAVAGGAAGTRASGGSVSEKMRISSTGNVGIGTTAPTTGAILDLNGTGVNYSSLLVPRDTSAFRPTVGVNGMIRYNTNLSAVETYSNNAWASFMTTATGISGNAGGDLTGTYPNPTVAKIIMEGDSKHGIPESEKRSSSKCAAAAS